MLVNLGYSGSEVGADEEFPALDFGLDDDEAEVGLGVHVAGHLFDFGDLVLDEGGDAVYEAVFGPSEELAVRWGMGGGGLREELGGAALVDPGSR